MQFLSATGTPLTNVAMQITMILWGKSGSGKTVLASTLPRPMLYMNFDPKGVASISKQDDITVLDLSAMTHNDVPLFKEGERAETELRNLLKANPQFKTIVVDSVTAFAQMALTHMILSGKGNGGKFNATMEAPGLAAYGGRNRIVLSTVRSLLRVAGEFNKHICFVCHEDTPNKDKDGVVESITLMLGGSLPQEVPLQISEVWHVEDQGNRRIIGLRPYAKRTPMRSRMFDTRATNTFEWKYDAITDVGMKITDWYDSWQKTGFSKIGVPT
jgi:hypothetical protein